MIAKINLKVNKIRHELIRLKLRDGNIRVYVVVFFPLIFPFV